MSEHIEDNHKHVSPHDVICQECNFRYGAEHRVSDTDGYRCPVCELQACQQERNGLRELLRHAPAPLNNPSRGWIRKYSKWCDDVLSVIQEQEAQ